MPFVIAIYHQKGGVAKTTTALSLGACFVEQRFQTLLMDLDPQANLTTGLGFNPDCIKRSSADILLGNDTLLKVGQETKLPGLDLVPSNADMLVVSRFLYLRPHYETLLHKAVSDRALFSYDFVIIDCPPTIGPLSKSALTAADLVIIPLPCEYFAIQALENIFVLLKNVKEKTNPLLRYRLLVTMFDRRGHLHTRVLSRLKEQFGDLMLNTMIGVDSKLKESQLTGQPVTRYASWTRGTRQYRELTQEILSYVEEGKTEAPQFTAM